MVRVARLHLLVAILAAAFCPTVAARAWAQPVPVLAPPAPTSPSHVISGNPFGLAIDLVNAEYERRAGHAVTVGIGGSGGGWAVTTGRPYVNADVFVRYYPGGQVFAGRSFGVKVGMTQLPGTGGRYFGVGVDANQTWMLSPHFAFSTGFGLKRLIGIEAMEGPRVIPTLRINIGVGF
jgi:opacity protein-like surface antigen